MSPGEGLVIVGMAVAVFVPKVLPLVVVSAGVAERLRPWLRYVAPAVLGALLGPAIFTPAGQLVRPEWPQAPFLVAFGAALLTRRMVPSVAAGLLVMVLVFRIQP